MSAGVYVNAIRSYSSVLLTVSTVIKVLPFRKNMTRVLGKALTLRLQSLGFDPSVGRR